MKLAALLSALLPEEAKYNDHAQAAMMFLAAMLDVWRQKNAKE